MTFVEWLASQPRGAKWKITVDAGVSPSTVKKLARGGRVSDRQVAQRIADATGGAVTAGELYQRSRKPGPKKGVRRKRATSPETRPAPRDDLELPALRALRLGGGP